MKVVSLDVKLASGLLALTDLEERSAFALLIEKRVDLNICNLQHPLHRQLVVNVLVESDLAHGVEILTNLELLRRDTAEFSVLEAHVHSIVNV